MSSKKETDVTSQDIAETDEKMTCAVLCSLSNSVPPTKKPKGKKKEGKCAFSSQHQLPMFLSKTYHMIDRCDPEVATWSDTGDNFVIKNVDQFSSSILPQYFKHSNFSSFARQLNFYGFRKMKAEPILTADFDARTAAYVRFFHANFQKGKPELLVSIRRATKSDPQSKDDMDSLRNDLSNMRELISTMSTDYERRMNEMTYEYNRRITSLSAEHDKLVVLVQQLLNQHPNGMKSVPNMMQSLSAVATAMSLQSSLHNPALLPTTHTTAASLLAAVTANQGATVATVGQKRVTPDGTAQASTDASESAAKKPKPGSSASGS